jgi:hypothetical protein
VSDDEDEFEADMLAARRADRYRTGGPVRAVPQLRDRPAGPCAVCGFVTEKLRQAPGDPGKLVCVNRYLEDAKGYMRPSDCYDRLDREQAERLRDLVDRTEEVIRAAKVRRELTDHDKAFLGSLSGGRDTIEALEAMFKRPKSDGPKKRGARREDV